MKTLLLLVSLGVAAPLVAQQASAPRAALRIKSSVLAETRTVYVATPPGYGNAQRRFPVLILLDADDQDQFNAAVANLRFLA